jgi:hypothetical protein
MIKTKLKIVASLLLLCVLAISFVGCSLATLTVTVSVPTSGTIIATSSPSPSPTPPPSTAYTIHGAGISADVFTSAGNPNYHADAWTYLEDLHANLIRVTGENAVSAGLKIGVDANWARNLDNFLGNASAHSIKVLFYAMGAKYGDTINLFGIIPYGTYGGVDISTAEGMIDQLAGANSLSHNFITDSRIYGWSVSNEQDMSVSGATAWNIAILDYIRALGGKAWVSAPYNSTAGDYLTASQTVALFGTHIDMLEFHYYGEYEYYHNYANTTASLNSIQSYFQSLMTEDLSTTLGNKVLIGEFGCWRGTGSNEGLTSVTFNDLDRMNVYGLMLNASRTSGVPNVCFFYAFGRTEVSPDYGIVKPNNMGTGYYDANLASLIRTRYGG